MNYRMSKTWGFLANVVWHDRVLCNDFRVCVDWTTVTDEAREQNIAYERVKYWLFDVLEHSILINENSDRVALYQATGQRVIALPNDPIDAMIAIMLMTKFSAITEGRMEITEIALSSEQGGHVQYLQAVDEDTMDFSKSGWWQDSRPIWRNKPIRGTGKVVNLDRMPEWAELDLAWDTVSDIKTDGSVVFAEFPKRAD